MTARQYSSPRRDAAAAATREAVLDAALALFTARGYAGASIVDVARSAGVTTATIYASVGSKPDLVLRLMERNVHHPEVEDVFAAVERATDPADVIARLVAGVLLVQRGTYPLLALLKDAARVEPSVAALATEAERLSRERFGRIVERLRALGALLPEVSPRSAVDVFWFYLGVQSWEQRSSITWESPEIEQAFLTRQLTHALVRPAKILREGTS
ncbi:TetR/AcrR family transcriptional regulator [Catenuloplanes japonicus]|uniref:TetR/AcrR family transcriptional regulator n=1 Tax=Catenuloplanes japonicus TaxID=33876 RepID=UPI00068F15A6|nr:TetR/AcrR family transcriptional regulator [Catenuloplanes japonicus]